MWMLLAPHNFWDYPELDLATFKSAGPDCFLPKLEVNFGGRNSAVAVVSVRGVVLPIILLVISRLCVGHVICWELLPSMYIFPDAVAPCPMLHTTQFGYVWLVALWGQWLGACSWVHLGKWHALSICLPCCLSEHGLCFDAGILDTAIVDRGRNVLSCSRDGTARLWDCGKSACLGVIADCGSPVNGIAVGTADNSLNLGTPEKSPSKGFSLKIQPLFPFPKLLRFVTNNPECLTCCCVPLYHLGKGTRVAKIEHSSPAEELSLIKQFEWLRQESLWLLFCLAASGVLGYGGMVLQVQQGWSKLSGFGTIKTCCIATAAVNYCPFVRWTWDWDRRENPAAGSRRQEASRSGTAEQAAGKESETLRSTCLGECSEMLL